MAIVYIVGIIIAIVVVCYTGKIKQEIDNPRDSIDIERICTERYLVPVLKNIFHDTQLSFSKHGHGWLNGALPLHDRLTINNQITTHIEGCRVVFSDFKTEKYVSDSDGDGHHYEMNWQGELYEIESKKPFSGFTRIIPTTTNKLGKEVNHKFHKFDPQREVKVETDNIWFNEHFDVYITVPSSRFYKEIWNCKENSDFINWVSCDNVYRQNQYLYQHVKQTFDFFNRQ